jgi:hypothetical protein
MDIVALTQSVAPLLIPLMPYLLKMGEKAAEEAGEKIGGATWEWGKGLWSKLRAKVEAKPAAIEAAQEVAKNPDDVDAQAALRLQLRKLLEGDATLAEEVYELVEKAQAAGVTVTASGDRSVAVGRDVKGSTIITGDSNRPPDGKRE